MTVGLEWAHAQLLGQGQGLLVVGFGLLGIGGIGVGMNSAKLVQGERLVPTRLLLPSQGERLARVLPGLLAASRQTPDLAEPGDRRVTNACTSSPSACLKSCSAASTPTPPRCRPPNPTYG